jgi:hypothetical protein
MTIGDCEMHSDTIVEKNNNNEWIGLFYIQVNDFEFQNLENENVFLENV